MTTSVGSDDLRPVYWASARLTTARAPAIAGIGRDGLLTPPTHRERGGACPGPPRSRRNVAHNRGQVIRLPVAARPSVRLRDRGTSPSTHSVTSRIALRPLTAADGDAFVAASLASRRLHRPWVAPPCDAEAFARHLARFDSRVHWAFVVCLRGTGELAGAIELTNVVRGVFQSGYLGYYAFAGFEGRGLMTQGLQAVVRHAFGTLGLHRLEANIQPANAASIALVRRCGFAREGYSPAYLKLGGRWRDHERWARVRGQTRAAC
jgi:ribosomal-protein-alanine N-acetyltransferase